MRRVSRSGTEDADGGLRSGAFDAGKAAVTLDGQRRPVRADDVAEHPAEGALVRVPRVAAVRPGQLLREGHEHEVKAPCQDDDVVDVHQEGDDRGGISYSAHDGANLPRADRARLRMRYKEQGEIIIGNRIDLLRH